MKKKVNILLMIIILLVGCGKKAELFKNLENVHSQQIKYLIFSQDNKKLISSGRDNRIAIWDVNSGSLIKKIYINYKDCELQELKITHDDKYLIGAVTYSKDIIKFGNKIQVDGIHAILIWDINSGQIIKTLTTKSIINLSSEVTMAHSSRISDIAISSDSSLIVSCGYDNAIRIWNLNSNELIKEITNLSQIPEKVIFTKDKKNVIVALNDKSIRIYNILTGEIIREFIGHKESVNALSLPHIGDFFYSLGYDGVFKWNINNAIKTKIITEEKCSKGFLSNYAKHSVFITSGNNMKLFSLWDNINQKKVYNYTFNSQIETISISSNYKYIAVSLLDNSIKILKSNLNSK